MLYHSYFQNSILSLLLRFRTLWRQFIFTCGLRNFHWISTSFNEDLKLRAMQSLESVFVRKSQCITEEDLDQLRCQPTSFSTNYKSSTLNFDLSRGPFKCSIVVVRVRSKEEAMCRRGPHNLWLKRATIRLLKINNIHSGAIVRTTESALNKSAHGNETRTFKYIAYSRFTFTGRIPNRIPTRIREGQEEHSRLCRQAETWCSRARIKVLPIWTPRGYGKDRKNTHAFVGGQRRERRLFDHAGHANFTVESPLARGSPDTATSKRWDLGRHDRSCFEMSEADGVDGGAFCKRGFIHLQFAEKLEAPEAERHLGSWILEVPVRPWVSKCSNFHAVGPGSELLVLFQKPMKCKYRRANGCIFEESFFQNIFFEGPMGGAHGRGLLCEFPSFSIEKSNSIMVWFGPSFLIQFHPDSRARIFRLSFSSSRISIHRRGSDISFKGPFHNRLLDANTGKIGRTLTPVSAGTGVVFSGAIKSPTLVGPQMQQPPRGGTWVGSTCNITKFMQQSLRDVV
ncbi:LOW QUALITY PROTEIN: hypothetical protein V1477_003185 [Vespula maculifrons]|uniref:Uncharacterized protein n=1 Tax=Vespula maculifrons TaxID=7453 RepID=A0ABD2CTU4_VESMC